MDIKIFSDMLDALGKITSALKAAASLPKAEREQYRQVIGQNYQLLDTTLGMIAIRLGDILLPASDAKFVEEVAKLDNYVEWMRIEREFRMCQSLRAALSEIKHFSGKLKARVSVNDIDALIKLMEGTTATEDDVAEFISARFHDLAFAARASNADIVKLRDDVRAFRDALLSERRRLIRDEVELGSTV
ncbi:MAG: hypothetical protein U5L03_06000 [Burkholderiaceae bacterium]|nr:hypothetical protein [Burkholderiaceae bacterium]